MGTWVLFGGLILIGTAIGVMGYVIDALVKRQQKGDV